jgi:hypothetical protein
MRKKEMDRLNAMVDSVAEEMKKKLGMKYREGLRGWETDMTRLLELLDKNISQKDYLDVAILAAMIYHFQWRNSGQGVSLSIARAR